jgi:hypothetical protein
MLRKKKREDWAVQERGGWLFFLVVSCGCTANSSTVIEIKLFHLTNWVLQVYLFGQPTIGHIR